jgi:uncharacterized protein YlxP (DUF503 family)
MSIKLEERSQNNIEFCDDPRVRIIPDENQSTIKNTTAVLVPPKITGNPILGITTEIPRPRRRRGSVDINHMCPRKDSSYSIPENMVQEYLDSNYTGSVYTQSKKGSLWKIKRDSEIGVMVPETMNSRHGNEISEESDSSKSDLRIERVIKETRSPKKTRGTANPNSLRPVLTQITPKSRFSVHQISNVDLGERNSISVKKISMDSSHNVSQSPNKQQKSDNYDKSDPKGFQIESSGNSIDGDLSPPKKKSIREILDSGSQAWIVEEGVDEIFLNDFSPTHEKLNVSQPFESIDSPTGKNSIPVEISPGSEEKKMI